MNIFKNCFKKFTVVLIAFALGLLIFSSLNATVFAQTTTPAASWVQDDEVSFVGKTGVRSGDFLDWTLKNYSWICIKALSPNKCDNTGNPLTSYWLTITIIVYGIIGLFVLATAFIMIITRGQNVTVMRFVPRFVFVIVFITLSFAIVQFIYQLTDVVQGFFLRYEDVNKQTVYITTKDLLYIGFDYKSFVGYRLTGPEFDESAFISLMLVRLTAITYYVMTGLLLVRKIILWFFIVISSVFPLLLFYKPIRNTAKIWIGEFFRWLLYAPLFAIFLNGLVKVWQKGIPLPFDFTGVTTGEIVYPTAINILLGGPGQSIGLTNSVNLPDTFALYVVALLMLWVVILLPFLLLKIFLDYIATLSLDNNLMFKQFVNRGTTFFGGGSGAPTGPPQPPGQFQPAGIARSLPFFGAKQAAVVPVQFQSSVQSSVRESTDIMRLANLSIPRMRDIAKYETTLMSRDTTQREQVSSFRSNLQKIANPTATSNISERQKFSTVRDKLIEQKEKGNPIASSILNASQVTVSSTSTQAAATTAIAEQQITKSIASSLLNVSNISNISKTATGITNQAQNVSTQNIANQTQSIANQAQTKQIQINQLSKTLEQLAHPERVITTQEKEKISSIKEQLMREKQKGNKLAESILEASEKVTNSTIAEDEKTEVKSQLIEKLFEEQSREVKAGAVGAPGVPGAKKSQPATLPAVNKVQQVSLEDYEEVRKLWTENYQRLEPPKSLTGQEISRDEWIQNDIEKINQAINLLSSVQQGSVNQGMSVVSSILPFLLIGGFSKSEVVAYLKAKMEAGRQVLTEMKKKEEEEESMVSAKTQKKEEAGTLKAEAEVPNAASAPQSGAPGEPKEKPEGTQPLGGEQAGEKPKELKDLEDLKELGDDDKNE